MTERDGRPLAITIVVFVSFVAPFLWLELHPKVHVVNLGTRALRIDVDSRQVGFVVPSWTEAPNGGLLVRVPVGPRSFEARDDQGASVDRSFGWIPVELPALYAPAHLPFCLWIEQRAYGMAAQPKPSVLRLAPEHSLYVLALIPDAWFQPNPAHAVGGRWFSGGIRRSVRHGRCESVPGL